mgnify:CR=1 FL=1|tara:strand:+ start:1257 stop:2069 length:813 start_codon:yes stop_codon:yes gene_type:complete
MGRTLKNLLGLSFVLLLAILASTSTYFSVKQKTEIPSLQEITDFQNNSNILLINKQTKVLHKSRASAVQVFSANIHQHLAMQSGTYVIAFERYFVLTTNHGIIGDCLLTKIYVDDKFRNCIRFIELNQESDYAIIEVEKIPSRKPVKIPQDLPTGRKQWTKALGVMNRVFYTGYPNSVGPLTIEGKVAGYHPDDQLYIISYAWSGSSGSGVFSQDGKYIGYVLAIDVGENNLGGAAILENVVLVIPAFKINWAAVLDVPQEVPEADDTAN